MDFLQGETSQMTSEQKVYCRDQSLNSSEQLFGTASTAQFWFLLEYPGPWGSKAFEESHLPDPVKEHLSSLQTSFPNARIQVIKRDMPVPGKSIAFFLIDARPQNPRMYQFKLTAYEDLLELDFPAVLSRDPDYQQFQRQESLYLICTNGRRDPCCARFGPSVYTSMAQQAGASVWQCSHLGGHRFAGNVLCFPHGIYYGRVTPEKASAILEANQQGQIYLENFRGRACYDSIVQAAEYFLRIQTKNRDLEAYVVKQSKEIASQQWKVVFTQSEEKTMHSLHLATGITEVSTLLNCRDEQPSNIGQYRLIDHQVIDS